jgi:transcriptional regulator with XRE-family HTH domain
MTNIKVEIGARLRKFGNRFKTMAEFARRLEMSPENLNLYLNGDRIPGNRTQEKLRALGCDLTWLMTGETIEEINKKFDKSIFGRARKLNDEDFKIIDFLHELNVTTLEEVKRRLTIYNQISEVVLKAAEPKVKYKTTKSRRERK